MPDGFVPLSASNIQDALGNKLAAGWLEVLPTDTNDKQIAATCNGPLMSPFNGPSAKIAITNGALPSGTVIPQSAGAATKPQNLCFRLTIKDAQGFTLQVFRLVQPPAGGINLDSFIPNVTPQAVIQYGPQGDKGDTGTDGLLTGDYRGTVRPAAVAFAGAGVQSPPSSIDGKYSAVFLDATGRKVLAGFRTDGTIAGFPGMATIAQISAIANVKLLPANSLGAAFAIMDAAGRKALWYIRESDGKAINGEVRTTVAVLYGTSPLPWTQLPQRLPVSHAAFTASLNHVLITGQSLSTGEDSKPVLTLQQAYDNVMFNGVRGCLNQGEAQTALVPLKAFGTGGQGDPSQRETCGNGFADRIGWYVRKHRLTHPLLMSACGYPGLPYKAGSSDITQSLCGPADLAPNGSQSYQWGMQHIASGKALATGRYAHQAVLVAHGEADANLGNNNYANNLVTWQSDYQAGSNAITGDTATVPFLLKQCEFPLTGLQQLAASVASPTRFLLVCPNYVLPHVSATQIAAGANALHLSNFGERLMGEYFAKAYLRHIVHGLPWTPFAPVSLEYGNRSLTLTYGGGDGSQIALDASVISDPGNFGFGYADGTGAQIVSVTVRGTNQIVVAFDRHIATASRTLSYATQVSGAQGAPLFGPRGCVRNTSPEMSLYPDSTGALTHLYDYSIAFAITF